MIMEKDVVVTLQVVFPKEYFDTVYGDAPITDDMVTDEMVEYLESVDLMDLEYDWKIITND
jgi:hypothetical protein